MFVAGGIGITVFRSMLRYVADKSLPYRITLVYSNRDRESAAFLDELPELERRIDGLRVVLTMTQDDGWDGESRRIDEEMLRDHLGELTGYTFLVAWSAGNDERRRGAAEGRRRSRGQRRRGQLQRLRNAPPSTLSTPIRRRRVAPVG